jgi:hypothetical protein
MPAVEAAIRTERAGRYLVQFCRHASAIGGDSGHPTPGGHAGHLGRHRPGTSRPAMRASADWSDSHGVVTFTPGGSCTLDAHPTGLTVRIDADDEDSLRRIRDIVAADLERFSHRDPLTVEWRAPAG